MSRRLVAVFAVVTSVVLASCGSSSSSDTKSDSGKAASAKTTTSEKVAAEASAKTEVPSTPVSCDGRIDGEVPANGAPTPEADGVVATGMTCQEAGGIAADALKDPASGCLSKPGASCSVSDSKCVSRAGDANDGGDYVDVTCTKGTATASFKIYYA